MKTISNILNSTEPTTFKEYQTWLKDWREVYAHETLSTRQRRALYTEVRNAIRSLVKNPINDGNASGMKLRANQEVEMQNQLAALSPIHDVYSRSLRRQLCEIRVERKGLGAALWRAQSHAGLVKETPVIS